MIILPCGTHSLRFRPPLDVFQFFLLVRIAQNDVADSLIRQPLENLCGQLALLLQNDIAALRIHQVTADHLPQQQFSDLLRFFFVDDPKLFVVITLELHRIFAFDTLGSFVLIEPLAREDFYVNDDALDARWHR